MIRTLDAKIIDELQNVKIMHRQRCIKKNHMEEET